MLEIVVSHVTLEAWTVLFFEPLPSRVPTVCCEEAVCDVATFSVSQVRKVAVTDFNLLSEFLRIGQFTSC